jgi:hypothetical protein
MIKTIFIDATIPSSATVRMTKNISVGSRQFLTLLFWDNFRQKCNFFISSYVAEECKFGDPEASRRCLEFLKGIPIIPDSEQIEHLATIYQKELALPDNGKIDCFHLAFSVYFKIDCLLSWNLKHFSLCNFIKFQEINEFWNLKTPLWLTPETLIATEAEEIILNYVDINPLEEVRRNQERLLEMYGGLEGLHKHMDEERPKLAKQGWKFLSEAEVKAL